MSVLNVSKRQRRRKRIVMIQKTVIIAGIVAAIGTGGILIYNILPATQVAKQLQAGKTYVKEEAYDQAIASYQAALELDSKSVSAYRAMAGAYLNTEDSQSAQQVLYKGWENTHDEGLFQYYCSVILNEAVKELNDGQCTFETVSKGLSVLEQDINNTEAYPILNTGRERLLQTLPVEDENTRFCSAVNCEGNCEFTQYLNILERLFALYQESGKEEIRQILMDYSVPQIETAVFAVSHIEAYRDILSRINEVEPSDQRQQTLACLEKAASVQEIFAPAFAAFDSGDFESVKGFMNDDTYLEIRDQFMAGTMEYWNGRTYIPVSREKVKLLQTENGVQFCFLDYDECQGTAGVIQVWGVKQTDAGIQRVAISYEPTSETGEYYPHTTYEIIYLYSNVKIGEELVPQMNYRFETKIATENGIATDLIGDWGGAHEWETSY